MCNSARVVEGKSSNEQGDSSSESSSKSPMRNSAPAQQPAQPQGPPPDSSLYFTVFLPGQLYVVNTSAEQAEFLKTARKASSDMASVIGLDAAGKVSVLKAIKVEDGFEILIRIRFDNLEQSMMMATIMTYNPQILMIAFEKAGLAGVAIYDAAVGAKGSKYAQHVGGEPGSSPFANTLDAGGNQHYAEEDKDRQELVGSRVDMETADKDRLAALYDRIEAEVAARI